jgi:alkanesulfonate monooxygenase SsuD/methylene tetrahydromethanopterin reductase-like flavin-dependent oxidoreductase (luciferase family)
LDVPFAARGALADECLAFWERAFVDGEVDGLTVLPRPVQQPRPPLWVGGNATTAMRRAAQFADGWDAPYADPAALRSGLERLRSVCAAVGRDPATLGVSVRGIAADALDAALVASYADLGVTDLGVMLPLSSPSGAVASLRALASRVLSP